MPENYELSPDHPLTIAAPYFPPEEQTWLHREFSEILNERLSMGPRTEIFQREFASYCGTSHGVALPSCTAALEIALLALDVKPGDEILVPAETFVATGMAVHLIGARPVFTEISETTFSMDFDDALSRVTDRTRGAIVVHFGGIIDPYFAEFVSRMRNRGLFVIEDDAHAHGAELSGRRAGSIADVGCFSFYPTKIMTTGEGGMLVTSRPDVARRAVSLQSRGLDLSSKDELYSSPGRNNRFTETAAILGLSQLRCLPGFLATRRRIAGIYDRALVQAGMFRPLLAGRSVLPSYWRYVVLLEANTDRVALKNTLGADGISIDWAYDPPLHLQPVFREIAGTRPGMLPRSESLLSRHICLPVNARMRDVDAEYVVERLMHHCPHLAVGAP